MTSEQEFPPCIFVEYGLRLRGAFMCRVDGGRCLHSSHCAKVSTEVQPQSTMGTTSNTSGTSHAL